MSEARFHPIAEETGDPADETPGMVFQITEAELAAAAYEVSDYRRVPARLKSGAERGSMCNQGKPHRPKNPVMARLLFGPPMITVFDQVFMDPPHSAALQRGMT
ncbi:MAG TPA: hypothetical protein VE309_12265, partial [Caulobacteraceae bacterium]|nr:hypothetical protein [Caulobacteraceae bacterium]